MKKKKIYFGKLRRQDGHLVQQLWINNRLSVARVLSKKFGVTVKEAFAFATCIFSENVPDGFKFGMLPESDHDNVRQLIKDRVVPRLLTVAHLKVLTASSFGYAVMHYKKPDGNMTSAGCLFTVPIEDKSQRIKKHNFIVPEAQTIEYGWNGENETIERESFSRTLHRAGKREGSFLWWQSSWKALKAATQLTLQGENV